MKISVLFVLLVLSGCATFDQRVWYQPGKTRAEIQKDWAESQLAAKRAALGYQFPILATDDGFAMGMAMRHQREAASHAKDIGILTMQSRGYELIPLSAVPTNAAYLKP